jgi:hypothetical protein
MLYKEMKHSLSRHPGSYKLAMSDSESSSLLLSGAQDSTLAPGSRTVTFSMAHVVRQENITSGMTIECVSHHLYQTEFRSTTNEGINHGL